MTCKNSNRNLFLNDKFSKLCLMNQKLTHFSHKSAIKFSCISLIGTPSVSWNTTFLTTSMKVYFCWQRSSYSNILRDNKIPKTTTLKLTKSKEYLTKHLEYWKENVRLVNYILLCFTNPAHLCKARFLHLKFFYVLCGGLAHKQYSHTRLMQLNIK